MAQPILMQSASTDPLSTKRKRDVAEEGKQEAAPEVEMLGQSLPQTTSVVKHSLEVLLPVAIRGDKQALATLLARCQDPSQTCTEETARRILFYLEVLIGQADLEALFTSALMYMHGLGIPKDEAKGIQLLTDAQMHRHVKATWYLSNCFLKGQGVPQDLERGLQMKELAAKRGLPEAMTEMGTFLLTGKYVEQNDVLATVYLEHAVRLRHREAYYVLGAFLLKRSSDLLKQARGRNLLQKAEEMGSDDARVTLASCMLTGHGVSKDEEKALAILKSMADKKHAEAQNHLGCYYRSQSRFAHAAEQFMLSVENGSTNGMCSLALAYQGGRGVRRDTNKALRLLVTAARSWSADAFYHLGNTHRLGIGVPSDQSKAEAMFQVAKSMRHPLAAGRLHEIKQEREAEAKQVAKMAWATKHLAPKHVFQKDDFVCVVDESPQLLFKITAVFPPSVLAPQEEHYFMVTNAQATGLQLLHMRILPESMLMQIPM